VKRNNPVPPPQIPLYASGEDSLIAYRELSDAWRVFDLVEGIELQTHFVERMRPESFIVRTTKCVLEDAFESHDCVFLV